MSYFTKENKEVRGLIFACISELDDCVKVEYLLNVLSAQHNQNKTIKEIFESELKAKQDFERMLEK